MAPEATAAPPPALNEARTWIGCAVDDIEGKRVGRARALFVDELSGEPTWLVAKLGRFSGPMVPIPMRDCAAGGGRIWVAHSHRAIRTAPVVDPQRFLLREHELTICAHYGIGERIARAAEVARGSEGSITSRPA
jgi:PRC-barrel domain protein